MTINPLVDKFGRKHTYLRISLTDHCNFQCVYCMPPGGWKQDAASKLLTDDEIVRVAQALTPAGIDKIRLTGGEPTLRRGLVGLVDRLASIPSAPELHLTTNGFVLARIASDLAKAGLKGINLSLDSLQSDRFKSITGVDKFSTVMSGIAAAKAAGLELKINTVVLAGTNHDEIADFVDFADQIESEVRFIEFMPFDRNGWKPEYVMGYREILAAATVRRTLVPENVDPGRIAKTFAIQGGKGKVGFITSMTEPFCSGCERLRLTADGKIKNCLFDAREVDLAQLLRNGGDDEAIRDLFQASLDTKWKEHPPMHNLARLKNRTMVSIGG